MEKINEFFKNKRNQKWMAIGFTIMALAVSITVPVVLLTNNNQESIYYDTPNTVEVFIYDLDEDGDANLIHNESEQSHWGYISEFFDNSINWNASVYESGILYGVEYKHDSSIKLETDPMSWNEYILIASSTMTDQCGWTIDPSFGPGGVDPEIKSCDRGFAPHLQDELLIENNYEDIHLFLTN